MSSAIHSILTLYAKTKPSFINGGPLPTYPSIFRHLERGLQSNPHGLAVISTHQPASHLSNLVHRDENIDHKQLNDLDCLAWTYSQIHQVALQLAGGLLANGIKPSSATILMMIPNGGEYALLLWMCVVLRVTFVSLDPTYYLNPEQEEDLKSLLMAIGRPDVIVIPGNDADKANLDQVLYDNVEYFFTQSSAANTATKQTESETYVQRGNRGTKLEGRGRRKNKKLKERERKEILKVTLEESASTANSDWKSLHSLAEDRVNSSISAEETMRMARNEDGEAEESTRTHSILFTSGTSGQPKGCPLQVGGMSHILHSQSWLITQDNSARVLQQGHNSRGIAPAQTLQTWREGGAVVMTGRGFTAEDLVMAIRVYRVTFVVMTPAMVHAVAQKLESSWDGDGESPPKRDRLGQHVNADSVCGIQIGGDVVTKDVLLKCSKLFPKARICVNHGMTEGGGAFVWPFDGMDQIPFLGEMVPVGAVSPGAIVKIWDWERDRVARREQSGELHICCGSTIPEYLEGRSAESFYEDKVGRRWFITGDVARMNRKGIVFILGRKKDMIRRKGKVVMPAVLESCLERLTGGQTCVIPIPHSFSNQEPFAIVQSLNGISKSQIQEHIQQTLGRHHKLGGIASLEQLGMKDFPLNGTHKVIKSEVEAAVKRYICAGNNI